MTLDEARAALSIDDGRMTLDALFSRAALRAPSSYALIDAPNRRSFAQGSPRFLTYAAADRAISAVARRLHQFGLARGAVVALQLPNIVESVIAWLAVLRAGMIAAPLPLLWRQAEIVPALTRLGAKAIIAGGRIGDDDLCQTALHVAAEVFPVRYVCSFAANAADGAIPLDKLLAADKLDPLARPVRADRPGDEVAVVTWDTTAERPEGHLPVARNHAQLIAAGLAVTLEGGIADGAKILAAMGHASLAGLGSALVPWLISGGTLHLHHAFDADVFDLQCSNCDTVVLPGPLAIAGHLGDLPASTHLRNVIAVWRTPERVNSSPAWRDMQARLTDVQVFGESGLIVGQRQSAGRPEPFGVGPLKVPRAAEDGLLSVEISRGEAGTLLLRGPMVPRDAAQFGADGGGGPFYRTDPAGFADTGFPCRIERDSRALVLTGPPAGLVNVGGYRFVQRSLQGLLGSAGQEATLAALPDPLLSHRLAGRAIDRPSARNRLAADGVNALVVGAFRDRRKPQAA